MVKKSKPKMKVVRVLNIATITTLASRHFLSMSSLVLLAAFASPTCAFSPAPFRKTFRGEVFNSNNRVEAHVNGRHHPSFSLYASEDDTVNGSNENNSNESELIVDDNNEDKINDEEDEEEEQDDEVDIITQKLRRNAENGPINPMKEHDKMMKENEYEAKSNTNLGTNGNSTSDSSVLYSQMLANAVDPDFDPDASYEEAYVESQFKELLSRKGKELSRLGPGIATLPLDPSSDEAKSEDELAQKELALQQVIDEAKTAGSEEWDESNLEESQKKQSEILERANKLQSEIDQLHVDDCGAVLLANLAFYEAFSLQDPEGMRDVWWQSPSVMCMHPSHPALIGSNAVFGSFTSIFENGMKGGARNSRVDSDSAVPLGVFMTPTNIRGFSVRGTTASLVCDEDVYAKGSGGDSISLQGGALVNKLLTTNMFRKIGRKWKMVHRHASWHPETTAAREAMKVEPGIVLYDESKDNAKSDASSNTRSKRANGMTLRKLNGDGTSKRPSGLPSIPPSLEGLDASAVLGIPMPKEEETTKSKGASDSTDGMVGKIINLSDLMGGLSGDSGDKDDDRGIGDTLADLIMGAGDSDSSSTSRTGSGTADDPFITRRIIKIGPEGVESVSGNKNKKANNEEDSDDDDEQEVVVDLRGKSDEERKEVLSQLVELGGSGDTSVSKEELRQKCIATLRKLSENGLLSSKQKRVLLTDIITSSARGVTSMVEVAYELLCTGEESDFSGEAELDTGMEDFTEQCRVFASMGDEDSR